MEVALGLVLERLSLIDLPQVVVDFVEDYGATFLAHVGAFRLRRLPGWESDESTHLYQRALDHVPRRRGNGERRGGVGGTGRFNCARVFRAGFLPPPCQGVTLHARPRRPPLDNRVA